MTVKAMLRPLNWADYDIPHHTQDALNRYYEDGLMPGGFLTAVLCNDLFRAVATADSWNIHHIKDICMFVYNEMPAKAWGSAERMRAWTEQVTAMKNGTDTTAPKGTHDYV